MINKAWDNDKLSSTSNVYKNNSDAYEIFSQAQDRQGKISKFLKPKLQDKIVLDFGCGTGKFIPQFAPVSEKYIATDISDSQLKVAREKAKNFSNVEVIKTERSKLPFEDDSVDVVFSSWVLGSIRDLELRKQILSELKRVLKPGGTIYLADNDIGGDFKEVLGGESSNKKTQAKLDWLEENNFWILKQIKTDFTFDSIKSAKKVFEVVWDIEAAGRVKDKVISINVAILEYAPNLILDSTKYVIDNSDYVKINMDKLADFADNFESQGKSSWLEDSPFDINSFGDERKLMFSVVFSALSFSYWGEPYWNVEYKGVLHTRGSWSLVASIFRSIEEGQSLLNPQILKDITKKQLAVALRGNTEIPMLQERVEVLNLIGKVLVDNYDSKFSEVIKESKGDALILLEIILRSFGESFDDSYKYKGKRVYFNKRAQILVKIIYSLFKGEGYGKFKNIESLTALADYIIPNLLRGLGILEYSEELINLIDNKKELEKGSIFEVEIRAGVVWTVEYMRRQLTREGVTVSAKEINSYLWVNGRSIDTPFHRTRTTAY